MPSSEASTSDVILIERLRANDEVALEIVMDRYMDDVVAIAFHYVRTTDAASDVAQVVFIHLWERRHALEVDGNLAYYLRRAARNAALKVVRHEAVVTRVAQAASLDRELLSPHESNTGSGVIETQEFNQQVRLVLDALSPRVREVALLYHERGLEPGEIAAMLGVAPRTIYNQLRTAMHALIQAFRRPDTGA